MLEILLLTILSTSSSTVINYDLLVGDIIFYNQTLMFALRENKEHGLGLLRLIEYLMAPWDHFNSTYSDENSSKIFHIIDSPSLKNSVMIASIVCLISVLIIIGHLLLSCLHAIYLNTRKSFVDKSKKSCYDLENQTNSYETSSKC